MSDSIPIVTRKIRLNNGVEVPIVASGSFGGVDPASQAKVKDWILTALKNGYRHIDTAWIYGTEKAVGEAIRESGIPREEIFVTTKLPWNRHDAVRESFEDSLKNLGLDYVDLYLMHFPQAIEYHKDNIMPKNPDGTLKLNTKVTFNESWAEMEKLLDTGKVRAIGVSNFSIKTLEQLFKTAKVTPAVNQVEMHPYLAQNELRDYCARKGIAIAAYTPSGYATVREDPLIKELAEKYKVSSTQIIFAWHLSRNTIIVPKSENSERQKENIRVSILSQYFQLLRRVAERNVQLENAANSCPSFPHSFMASDSSDSPILLTPESTGTSHGLTIDTSLPGSPTSGAAKKSKRGTAFYPNVNSSNKPQKPFSRSAAKRESVMALGSIEHLQHYFTKTGLAAKKNPLDKPHAGLVRAIGGMGHVPTSPSLSDIQDFQMPPSPAVPTNPPNPIHSPHVKVAEVDPESLLPGVIDDVITAAQAWKLDKFGDAEENADVDLDVHFDVLDVLKTTTRAIRSTRNYLLSLPDEEAGTIRAQFRPALLGPGSRASSSTNLSASTSGSSSSSGGTPSHSHPDPLVLIRRSALEVLATLRQVEETCRLPLSDDAYDAQSDGGHSRGAGTASSPSNGYLELPPTQSQSHSHHHHQEASNGSYADPDASITFSLVQVNGRYQNVPVWEDEEDVFAVDSEEEKERRERWDERLVLGSGWLYRQDVKLRDLRKERAVVGAYLDIVDEVLFDGRRGAGEERGWDRVRRKREG
ncbi:hypothetical protein CVT26_008267, partial [Gymnopilus dilepis]